MTKIRLTSPGQVYQGADEHKAYVVNVGKWFATPTVASAKLYQGTTDISACNLSVSGSGGATISGSLVTTPCVVSLTAGTDYRLELMVEQSGERLECFFYITGE